MGVVIAVSMRAGHHFSKTSSLGIRLLAGLGVAGDGHMGTTVNIARGSARTRRSPICARCT
jgi:hypothetical protein